MKTLSTKSTKSRRIYLQLITYITYMYCIRIVSYFRCKIYDNKWSTKCVGLQMAGHPYIREPQILLVLNSSTLFQMSTFELH